MDALCCAAIAVGISALGPIKEGIQAYFDGSENHGRVEAGSRPRTLNRELNEVVGPGVLDSPISHQSAPAPEAAKACQSFHDGIK